ncbi:hypothetical protein LZ31DRAFT_342369 [Colletotrichum somersetense]|nr:hypothetical protein LZ31DRAFT_342369 [Colletotrichum somersetense]
MMRLMPPVTWGGSLLLQGRVRTPSQQPNSPTAPTRESIGCKACPDGYSPASTGRAGPGQARAHDGWVRIWGSWQKGDNVTLSLQVPRVKFLLIAAPRLGFISRACGRDCRLLFTRELLFSLHRDRAAGRLRPGPDRESLWDSSRTSTSNGTAKLTSCFSFLQPTLSLCKIQAEGK